MINAPYLPQDVIDSATRSAVAAGITVLQGARLAGSDEAHISSLLHHMAPSFGDTILDAGCGFGEVSRLMKVERPDLNFILVNKNGLQMSYAPGGFPKILGDMHSLPLVNSSMDGVMFCYSLCHSDFEIALAEAARVTRPGGFLFVYDYDRIKGDNALFLSRLCAWAIPHALMEHVAVAAGWVPVMHENVCGDDILFREAYGNDEEYDTIFDDLSLAVWKMVRHD